MKRYINADENMEIRRKEIYTTYAPDTDITFIMADEWYYDEVMSTECVGFYFGEPNSSDTDRYVGKLKARF